jgi:hypothetical protein
MPMSPHLSPGSHNIPHPASRIPHPGSRIPDGRNARLSHLKVISSLWATSARRALEHALDMDDLAVLVDVLNASQQRLGLELGTELALDLVPSLSRLLDSEYEDYLIAGLNTVCTLTKAVGPALRDMEDAVACGFVGHGVD